MGGTVSMILPLIILLLVMYFLLIRPQKKREREINNMRNSVQVGDEIITIGGICGKVVKTKDDSLVIQVGADKVKFEIMRWAVSKIVEEGRKHSSKAKPQDYDDDEETEVKKAKPKRMKKAAPVEEEPEAEEAPAEEEPAVAEDASEPEAVTEAAEEATAEEDAAEDEKADAAEEEK